MRAKICNNSGIMCIGYVEDVFVIKCNFKVYLIAVDNVR